MTYHEFFLEMKKHPGTFSWSEKQVRAHVDAIIKFVPFEKIPIHNTPRDLDILFDFVTSLRLQHGDPT